MLAEPPDPTAEIADVLEVFATVLRAAPVREIEVVLAFLSLLVLRRVEESRTSAAGADQLLTLIDVELTNAERMSELSDDATDLLLEGHHFHHWGVSGGPIPQRYGALPRPSSRHPASPCPVGHLSRQLVPNGSEQAQVDPTVSLA